LTDDIAVLALGTTFGDACRACCPLYTGCRSRAWTAGDPAVLGDAAAQAMTGLDLTRAAALVLGKPTGPPTSRAPEAGAARVAAVLERAAVRPMTGEVQLAARVAAYRLGRVVPTAGAWHVAVLPGTVLLALRSLAGEPGSLHAFVAGPAGAAPAYAHIVDPRNRTGFYGLLSELATKPQDHRRSRDHPVGGVPGQAAPLVPSRMSRRAPRTPKRVWSTQCQRRCS